MTNGFLQTGCGPHVVVVGAGIGGLAAAVALQQRGYALLEHVCCRIHDPAIDMAQFLSAKRSAAWLLSRNW